jgi:hypothetical protein
VEPLFTADGGRLINQVVRFLAAQAVAANNQSEEKKMDRMSNDIRLIAAHQRGIIAHQRLVEAEKEISNLKAALMDREETINKVETRLKDAQDSVFRARSENRKQRFLRRQAEMALFKRVQKAVNAGKKAAFTRQMNASLKKKLAS